MSTYPYYSTSPSTFYTSGSAGHHNSNSVHNHNNGDGIDDQTTGLLSKSSSLGSISISSSSGSSNNSYLNIQQHHQHQHQQNQNMSLHSSSSMSMSTSSDYSTAPLYEEIECDSTPLLYPTPTCTSAGNSGNYRQHPQHSFVDIKNHHHQNHYPPDNGYVGNQYSNSSITNDNSSCNGRISNHNIIFDDENCSHYAKSSLYNNSNESTTRHCTCTSYRRDDEIFQPYFLKNQQKVQLRFLNPGDYDIVKKLCEEWFPVEYPSKWFEAITSDPNLFSLAAIIDGRIIGLIVAELKQGKDLNREDKDILCDSQLKFTAAYILSLGVVESNRRQGIASLLLSSLLNHLSTLQCKAVFLHVLTSNQPALHFYERHQFKVHKFLPYYYSIGGRSRDGFTHVLYLNGGHGPWGFHEYMQHFCQVTMVELCSFPQWFACQIRKLTHSILTIIK